MAMRHLRLLAVVILVIASVALAQQPAATNPAAPGPVLSAQRLDDRIIVRVDDRMFTSYRFGAGQKYPYFYPVNGPVSGVSVTTESSLPWPHHRSLFFGSDKVNGGNYWQEGNDQGQIVSRGATVVDAGPDRVVITDECEWRKPGTAPVLVDRREIRIEAPSPALRTLAFRVTLVPQAEVRIEKTNHSLFAARVAPELSAQSGGALRNAAGALGEKGTFGASSPWCDVSGTRFGLTEGLAIFDSPRNRWYPSKWFTRDYGFLSPTPFNWLDDAGLRLAKGETLELEYLVVVHAGDAAEAGIAGIFDKWAEERAQPVAGSPPPRWNSLGTP
jgi:hypothetical protein